MTLDELYQNYVQDFKLTHKGEEVPCYVDWLHNDFANALATLSDWCKCDIYNEYADRTGRKMWDTIESLNEYQEDNFLEIYRKINHERFNPYDDIIIEESSAIVSYTCRDFIQQYWNLNTIINFIHVEGLESLANMDNIVKAVMG